MKTALLFPGDTYGIGVTRYRLRRTGRQEWLDTHANPTDDESKAASFMGPIDAVIFATHYTDEPQLWHFEPYAVIDA